MVCLGGYIVKAHFECHDIRMLGKSLIKRRQKPDITIAIDWDVKHQLKKKKNKKKKKKKKKKNKETGMLIV